jgi:hypothetical protein
MDEKYIVYIKVNSSNCIIDCNSPAFLTDPTGWIEIDEGSGDKYHHAQGHYFNKPIMTMNGAYCYKLVDGKPVECSADEIALQEEANKPLILPSTNERLEALEAAVIMLCLPDAEEV